jgi:hypothetical protein
MAARREIQIRPVTRVQLPVVDDLVTQRALEIVEGALQDLQAKRNRDVVTFDLVIGTNRVRHGLGRACAGYTLTPTVADRNFAHAIDTTNPRPDLEVWVVVIGADQPTAILEVY